MKRRAFVASVFAGVLCLSGFADAANVIVGTGSDYSFFVLESPNIGSRTYEVYYNHNPLAPLDAWALLQIIDAADNDLSLDVSDFGDPGSPNIIINAITWLGVTETNTSVEPWSPSWGHSVSGGEAGWPSAVPVDSGTWSIGSGVSAPYRFIEPGSWDGLVYGNYGDAPSVAPVPEPSAALLALAGGSFFVRRRRAA